VSDIQIHVAIAHLRIEEIISGEAEADLETVLSELDQAIHLADAVLNGGKVENFDRIPGPLTNPELRTRAEAVKNLVARFKQVAMERLQEAERSQKNSTRYLLFHSTFREALIEARRLEDSLERYEALNQEKSRILFLAIPGVWALVVAAAGTALWSLERQRRKSEGDLRKLNEQLLSQAEELKDHRERLTELIDARTAELSGANARLSVEASEREMAEAALKASETQLRMLSARLMSAQETERRNIARELHDELGHSLTIMKLRLKSVERKLQAHADIRDNCDDIIKFIDQTIESVRRLSRDLSPAILEDLGLTAAIHWLMDNFSRNFDGDMELDIEDIDHLFTENSQIMIYRVLQEAVTNIGKHAQAGKVSVVIKKTDARVSFVIQDNGKGFGSPLSLMRDPAGKGLGLAIMEERARMLNGSLDVQSQEGIGTRIAFSIPLQEVKP
jgi:signal transduction histidine kinase